MIDKWLRVLLYSLKPGFHITVREPATACDCLRRSPAPWKFIRKHKSMAACNCLGSLEKIEPVQLLRHLPAHSDSLRLYGSTNCDSCRQPVSPLLLRINHVLITVQLNGLNVPNAYRFQFLTIPYGYMGTGTGRLPAIDAGSRRQSLALLRLYGNQA